MSDTLSTAKHLHVHVIYEYGSDYRPYSSSFLRLIRPLTHPRVREDLSVSFGLDYHNEPADIVILDRLWRGDITLNLAEELINKIRLNGSRFVYSLDDNYLDQPTSVQNVRADELVRIVTLLLRQADGVLVTTPALRQRLQQYNPNIQILPNQLDERLLVIRPPTPPAQALTQSPTVIGYMGTFTHDADLMLVLPALQALAHRYQGLIQIQVVGVVRDEQTKSELLALPVRFVYPRPEEHEYPLFMPWFTGHVRWDIAISPLISNTFNDCKSDVKFLDYASIGTAGIFSQSQAYLNTVHHQQNGWVVENTPAAWEEAIGVLIDDRSLRYDIARNAHNDLFNERILAHRAIDWVEIIKSMS
jgi:processive 1,2-diacylglycerol beta-glucosyltransferase